MAVRHTEQDWLSLLEVYEYKCFGCGVQSDKLTRDHIVPVSKGGGDEIENIAPLCSSCNSKKGVHGPEWYMQKWLAELKKNRMTNSEIDHVARAGLLGKGYPVHPADYVDAQAYAVWREDFAEADRLLAKIRQRPRHLRARKVFVDLDS
jgi:hypothetical protein